jgi:predicted dehydrogenase
MSSLSRRDFLQTSAGVGATLAGMALLGASNGGEKKKKDAPAVGVIGANERLNVAVVGVNGRGRDHVRGFDGHFNCRVTVICDADSAVGERVVARLRENQTGAPAARFEQDIRRVVEDPNIHIVSVATPNHWHALAAIWAIQHGKDVYVEKPVSHNVSEGRRIVEAARHHNRICQAGTQSRSSPALKEAIAWLRDGNLGAVRVARALCYKRRGSIGRTDGDQRVPSTVDYNLWCGPAPRTPLMRRSLHYDWHWQWNYGNGDLGNQGIHQMDIARWGLGKSQLCTSVLSVGGRFSYTDDGETPNTQVCVYDYGDSKLIFEVRGLDTPGQWGTTIGNIFHCANGTMVIGASYASAIAFDLQGRELRRFNGRADHYGNFVSAVRSRRRQDLNADILEGHLSSALCHLGNVSYRLGEPRRFDEGCSAFGSDKDALVTVASMREHLEANGLLARNMFYRLGRRLNLNPQTERFINDNQANTYLTREYRTGFVVPASIG